MSRSNRLLSGNVLILRNDVSIFPKNRRSVSYEYLASLIADYLVSRMSEDDSALEGLSAALSKLPDLQEGMDINSVWSNHTAFKQLGEGGELKLFQLCGVELVHGWLADPASEEYEALMKVGDYDAAVNLIVAADDLTRGRFVESDQVGASPSSPTETIHFTEQQQQVIRDAFIIRNFLDTNSSQLTYNGLFTLSNSLAPGNLYAFFRNSHLSVLLKTTSSEQPLYTLVTDSAFAREEAVVWETLEDVDGSASMFVDATFIKASTAGGDYSGRSAEAAVRDAERAMQGLNFDADLALAQQMQAEEDAAAQEAAQRREDRRAGHQQQSGPRSGARHPDDTGTSSTGQRTPASSYEGIITPEIGSRKKKKDNKDCIIM
ncbi:hypothetical protein FRB93_004083 [Tulasnella sp. JGI-2019a]|nr:hypothetical protein FRB93_004083 [Tulasnella sp. JGI-2019a]